MPQAAPLSDIMFLATVVSVPCILAMRMTFRHITEPPKNFRFIADRYSAYPLAAMEFAKRFKDNFKFNITQVIGLTNDNEVSK